MYPWVEKYRPKSVDECIFPDRYKKIFEKLRDAESVPNLMLVGGPGIGKTTIAKALLNDIGCDYIVINGSLEGNIETLRTDIMNFASTKSLFGNDKKKFVILDEAEYLSANLQHALRNFMEEYSGNCGFILTCNYKNKIIEPLHSRCSVIEFDYSNEDIKKVAVGTYKKLVEIFNNEGVNFDKEAIALVLKEHLPDIRRIINECQKYAITNDNNIDIGIVSFIGHGNISKLVDILKEKNYDKLEEWVEENTMEPVSVMKSVYYELKGVVKPNIIPNIVLIIGRYQFQNAFVADKNINLLACLTEIMMEMS